MTDQSAEPRPSNRDDASRHEVGRSDTGASTWWMPRWVLPTIVLFWVGYLLAGVVRATWGRITGLVVSIVLSLFVALAIEPGVNRLSRRGWRRGTATITILLGGLAVVLSFGVAIGALVGSQVAELLSNTETYITDTVKFINDNFGTNINADDVIESYRDPQGPVQEFIRGQQDNALRLSVTALGMLLQLFTVLLFSFYLVADGPRMRRAICARLRPERQERVLATWEMAASKTGGYLYSRGLLALISAVFHWIVFQALGTAAPIPLALWVGVVSQFMPVVGTYLAGVVPVVIMFLDSPMKALIVLIAIVLYQQVENYLLSPRVTARTMDLHPALAFGAALAGASVLGVVGALVALPTAAMIQAVASSTGVRYDVIDSELVRVRPRRRPGRDPADDRAVGGLADAGARPVIDDRAVGDLADAGVRPVIDDRSVGGLADAGARPVIDDRAVGGLADAGVRPVTDDEAGSGGVGGAADAAPGSGDAAGAGEHVAGGDVDGERREADDAR